MANSLDLVICHPYLIMKGGGDRCILELAKRFTPVIYTHTYLPEDTFKEFAEFDVRVIKKSPIEPLFNAAASRDSDARTPLLIGSGLRYFPFKIKHDYDVVNPHGVPSEWVALRNKRVCWYCQSPCRAAYDLYPKMMKERGLFGKAIIFTAATAFKMGESLVIPKIERICTNSKTTEERIRKYLGRNDAEIVHPGVDTGLFRCESYGKYFLCVSRILPEKRFEIAIEAFRNFSKKKKGYKLVIAGFIDTSQRNRQYFASLQKAARGLSVEFKLNPAEDSLEKLYANCFATLFCAINEDWGLVPVESMASEKPCISVNEGGPRESIVNGRTGFLVNSVEEMAEKMKFLAEHPNECEKMGRNGRKRVLQNYTWKIFLDKMDKAFRETAKGKSSS